MSSRASSHPSNASRLGSAQTGYVLGRPSASGPYVASHASRIFRNLSASASSIDSRSMHRASSPNRPIIGYRDTVSIGSINVSASSASVTSTLSGSCHCPSPSRSSSRSRTGHPSRPITNGGATTEMSSVKHSSTVSCAADVKVETLSYDSPVAFMTALMTLSASAMRHTPPDVECQGNERSEENT